MLSEMFYKLWNNGLIQLGVWETIYMTLVSSAIAYVIGLPLGVILSVTDAGLAQKLADFRAAQNAKARAMELPL